jgi:hypothetical protein
LSDGKEEMRARVWQENVEVNGHSRYQDIIAKIILKWALQN